MTSSSGTFHPSCTETGNFVLYQITNQVISLSGACKKKQLHLPATSG